MDIVPIDSLSTSDKELIARAQEAAERAYAPYSNFKVGAAIRTTFSSVYTGCNVENVSYLAIHAEWSAIGAMVNGGETGLQEIAVAGLLRSSNPASGKDENSDLLLTPCGICRQKIFEFAQLSDSNVRILCCAADSTRVGITTIDELLPHAFGPKNLAP